jgi:hypothetical protein
VRPIKALRMRSPPSAAVVTLNPLDKSAKIALSSGNLIATKNTDDALVSVRATRSINAATENGYFEVVYTNASGTTSVGTFCVIGVSPSSTPTSSFPGSDANSWGYYQDTGEKVANAVQSAYGSAWKTPGQVIGVAVKNGSIWFALDGVWQNSGNPAAGTGAAFTGLTGAVFPTLALYKGGSPPVHEMDFRATSAQFAYAPPSGFAAWG